VIFPLWQLFLAGVGYLLLLFLIAYAAERGWIGRHLIHHPLTYVLSLGVYATSWTFYGSVGYAQDHGYGFLTIYLGVTLAFILAPVLLRPILRLVREYQFSSLADLLAFRYQSQLTGVLVTLFMLAGSLPYIALQIRAVTASLQVLTQESTPALIALGFCVTLSLFAILFGARHISAREKHEGLVLAIAFESLVKLFALLAVGLFALFGLFEGPDGLSRWLRQHPEALAALHTPVREGPWATLLLLSFCAAFLLPRQFHMTFTENLSRRALNVASWGFPLYLLLLNLFIPVILWAGQAHVPHSSADLYVLSITLTGHSGLLPVFTFIGGLSAASAMMIVTTLALAAMCMNHLVLPAVFPPRLGPQTDLYAWLLWGRRLLIGAIIAAGYGFYLLLEKNQGLAQLGLISFVAVAQLLPGIVGLLFWRNATRTGLVLGLLVGGGVWAITLIIPLLQRSGLLETQFDPLAAIGADPSQPWGTVTLWSLSLNALLFAVGSLLTRPSSEEVEASRACCRDPLELPTGLLVASSPQQIEEQLARVTGPEMAAHEVARALTDLRLDPDEQRPGELRRLRERIERNLTGLVGPMLARMIVDERLSLDQHSRLALTDSVRYIEERMRLSRTRLQGLAAELDALRRYHQQVLRDLPLGVCAITPERVVVSWNQALSELTGLGEAEVTGRQLQQLPEPWSGLFGSFLDTQERHLRKVKVRFSQQVHLLNLHKAAIDEQPDDWRTPGAGLAGSVLLVEDLTELYTLENELTHSERLASVGRLAAGVAHEVGNPVTAIACLAQNLVGELEAGEEDPEFTRESLLEVLQQTGRISAIVQTLVSFSHAGAHQEEVNHPIRPTQAIEEALRLVRLSKEGKRLHYDLNCVGDWQVLGDHQRMVQVFVNLLTNACDASPVGASIDIDARPEGRLLRITVADQGRGIADEHLDRIFEPFFTTKAPGEGTGLGLPLVYNIVQDHGGTIHIDSEEGYGTRVTLRLPLLDTQPLEALPHHE